MADMKVWRRVRIWCAFALLATACSSPTGASPTSGADLAGSEATSSSNPAEAVAPGPAGTSSTDSAVRNVTAPEFPEGLDWLNTEAPITLEALRGKIVLLDFWTYGCINCIHVIPDLKRLEAEFPDELVVIGVHSAKFVNESATENIRNVVLRYGVDHPVVNDRDFEVWQQWGAQAWPTTVLIDPEGNVVGSHAGEGVYQVVAPVVASLVEEFGSDGRLDTTPLDLRLEKDGLPAGILSFPGKVHVATGDPRIFIADSGRHRIVVADRATGDVLAVYGDGRPGFVDGAAAAAQFDAPQGMELSADGQTLYVADTNNHAIRIIDTETGDVGTLIGTGSLGWPPAGGAAPDVALNSPWDVLRHGDLLYIAMAGHHQIWVLDLTTGIAAPRVGNAREGVLNGPFDQAELAQPSGLALDTAGRLYFADSESSSIRVADVAAPQGTTQLVAGGSAGLFDFGDVDGVGELARFQHPLGVVVWRDRLIVADTYNGRLRLVDPVSREVTTLLGSEQGWADGADPRFYEPGGLAIDGDTLYVADTNNHAVRVVDLPSGATSTFVLRGIEVFEPRPGDADYRGTLLPAQSVTAAPGTGEIVVDVSLPVGYKINEEAPSSLTIEVDGDVVVPPTDVADLTGASLPVSLPVALNEGSAQVTADLVLVYCREGAESLCLIEQVRFRLDVTVAGDASSDAIVLEHAVAAS